jgi:hypothetical protein
VEENCLVPQPINFNCWKHHTEFIKRQIESVKKLSDLIKLKKLLLKIGESQMDLYFGVHTPSEISEQIIKQLEKRNVLSKESYTFWLNDRGLDYKLLSLSDDSIWTLRKGNDNRRYVHIHPGRYSPHTRRVKAPTLKTAIFTLCYEKVSAPKMKTRDLMNLIRKEYLDEPPLKAVSGESGLGKLLNLLRA